MKARSALMRAVLEHLADKLSLELESQIDCLPLGRPNPAAAGIFVTVWNGDFGATPTNVNILSETLGVNITVSQRTRAAGSGWVTRS